MGTEKSSLTNSSTPNFESHKSSKNKSSKSSHGKHEKVSYSFHKSLLNNNGCAVKNVDAKNEYEKRVKRLEKKLKELKEEMSRTCLENGTSKPKRNQKNGYKKKKNEKKPKKRGRKRKHLSDSESDDESPSFNHENLNDLRQLKADLENLHGKRIFFLNLIELFVYICFCFCSYGFEKCSSNITIYRTIIKLR